MAALSRPSLRSSAQKNPDTDLPATDVDLPAKRITRRQGKRTRDTSLDNESNASSKRLKNSPQGPRSSQVRSNRSMVTKSLPIRDKPPPPKSEVTQLVHRPRKNAAVEKRISNATQNAKEQLARPAKREISETGIVVPQKAPSPLEKRSLRSHDGGSRSKSELSLYFPNYDELISIEPKTVDFLTPETVLFVTDDVPPPSKGSQKSSASESRRDIVNNALEIVHWPGESFSNLTDSVKLDLSKLASKPSGRSSRIDPLDDELFIKIHRRLERQEKQLRNIEKERAMHEKVQLERLLEGLKGHDWLRTMGISGITDGEKKAYEPKRDRLIREVKILLEKFRLWKEEEKRRKLEREEEEEGDEDEDEESEEDVDEDEEEEEEEGEDKDREIGDDDDGDDGDDDNKNGGNGDESNDDSDPDSTAGGPKVSSSPPDYTEIDASAARQLHLEATRASQISQQSIATIPSKPPRRRRASSTIVKQEPSTVAPMRQLKQQTITSFFAKPYVRDAAIGNHRRGRSRFAFGQPLPEPDEKGFELPTDILTDAAMAASDRGRRAVKRGRQS